MRILLLARLFFFCLIAYGLVLAKYTISIFEFLNANLQHMCSRMRPRKNFQENLTLKAMKQKTLALQYNPENF